MIIVIPLISQGYIAPINKKQHSNYSSAGVSAGKINGGAISLISNFPMSINLTNNTLTTYIYTFKAVQIFWADTEKLKIYYGLGCCCYNKPE